MSELIPELCPVYRLTDIDISFVSVCGKGANPGAQIVLKKEWTMSKQNANLDEKGMKKEDGSTVNVNSDTEALAKSMGDALKAALPDLLKKQDVDAATVADACTAVINGELVKMAQDINNQTQEAIKGLQKEFDGKVAALKEQQVNKNADDETVIIGNSTFKKSVVGDGAFAALKASAEQTNAIAKELEHQKLVSRVEKEYPEVAGTPEEKAAFLGYIEKADEGVKKIALSMLKSLNDMGADFAKECGAGGKKPKKKDPASNEDEATAKLDELAKAYMAKNNVSFATAYAEVLKSDEGERLYNEHRGE